MAEDVDDAGVSRWLSPTRFGLHLSAAGGDQRRALQLHEWNAQLGAAFLHDLGHLELGLRNAYDRALTQAARGEDSHWTDRTVAARIFPDKATRGEIEKAHDLAGRMHADTSHRRVVTCLTFGFWTHLGKADLEKSLWVPYLQRAWDPRTDRAKIHGALVSLREFRNRAAHLDPLLRGAENTRRQIVSVVRGLSPDAAVHLNEHSTVAALLASRP